MFFFWFDPLLLWFHSELAVVLLFFLNTQILLHWPFPLIAGSTLFCDATQDDAAFFPPSFALHGAQDTRRSMGQTVFTNDPLPFT